MTDAEGFFRNALLFLAYTPLEIMNSTEQASLALDMSICALIGEKIFNFGELLAHPILESLGKTKSHGFMVDLLRCFNKGDIAAFDALVASNASSIKEQPILTQNMPLLQAKIKLLCLVELCFSKDVDDRCISFSEVATKCVVPAEQVELLLMRSMSLGLTKGIIDQVDETFLVTWVTPRILGMDQVQVMVEKLGNRATNAHSTMVMLEEETPELLEGIAQ